MRPEFSKLFDLEYLFDTVYNFFTDSWFAVRFHDEVIEFNLFQILVGFCIFELFFYIFHKLYDD